MSYIGTHTFWEILCKKLADLESQEFERRRSVGNYKTALRLSRHIDDENPSGEYI